MILHLLRNITPRGWLVVAVIVLALFVLCQCAASGLVHSGAQKRDIAVARTTGKALDKVAAQTPIIRNDQKDREHDVQNLPGADARLPDGFGADLERVRQRQRD